MTSREATTLLPRDIRHGPWRRPADWLWLIGIGAIQWPWLLRSLWGGRRRDKAALLERLGLPEDALPHLGSWKADVGFLTALIDHIERHRPAVVVELGAGASTLVIAAALALYGGGRLVSFDQDDAFTVATRAWLAEHGLDAELYHAPLTTEAGGGHMPWYRLDHVPPTIDMLVIDGPPWTVHPLVRGASDALFDRIAPGGSVFLDDAARPGERIIARQWQRRWPGFKFVRKPGIKGILVAKRVP